MWIREPVIRTNRTAGDEGRADEYHAATGHQLLDAQGLGAGIVIAVPLHEVDHTPHSQTGTEGNNERLKDRNRLIDKIP